MSYKAVKWWSRRRQTGEGAIMSEVSSSDDLKLGLISTEKEYNEELDQLVTLTNNCITWSVPLPSYRRRTIATTTQQVMDCSNRLLGELESYLTDKLPMEGIYHTLATHLEHYYVYYTYCSQLEELRTMLLSVVDQNGGATDSAFSAKFQLERSLLPIYRLQEMRAQLKAMLPILTACNYRVEIFHCGSTIDQITQILDQCFKVLNNVNGADYVKKLNNILKDCRKHKHKSEVNTTRDNYSHEQASKQKNKTMYPNNKHDIQPSNNPEQSEHDCDKTEGNKESSDKDKTIPLELSVATRQSARQQSSPRSSKKGNAKILQRLSTDISKPNRTKTNFKTNVNKNSFINPVLAINNNYPNISVFPLQLQKPYEESIFTIPKNHCRCMKSSGRCSSCENKSESTRNDRTCRAVSRLGGDVNATPSDSLSPPSSGRTEMRCDSGNVEMSLAAECALAKYPTAETQIICCESKVGGPAVIAANAIKIDGTSSRRKTGPAVPKKRYTNLNRVDISPELVENVKATTCSNRVHDEVGFFENPIHLKKKKPVPLAKPRRITINANFPKNFNGNELSDKSKISSEKVESTPDVTLRGNFRNRSMTNQHLQNECTQMDLLIRHTRCGVIVGRNQDWRTPYDDSKLNVLKSQHANEKITTTEYNQGTITQKTVIPRCVIPECEDVIIPHMRIGECDCLDTSTHQTDSKTLQSPLDESSTVNTAYYSKESNCTKTTSPTYENGSFEVVKQRTFSTEANQLPSSPETSRENSKYQTQIIIQVMKSNDKHKETARNSFKSSTHENNVPPDCGVSGGEPLKSPSKRDEPSEIASGLQQHTGAKEEKGTTSVSDEAKQEGSRILETPSILNVRPLLSDKENNVTIVPSEINANTQLCQKRFEDALKVLSTISEIIPGFSGNVQRHSEETHKTDTLIDESTKMQPKSVPAEDYYPNARNVLEQDYECRFLSILENTNTRGPEMSSGKQYSEYHNNRMFEGVSQNMAICKSSIEKTTRIENIVSTNVMDNANVTTQNTLEDNNTTESSKILDDRDTEKSQNDGTCLIEIAITVQKANDTDHQAVDVDNEHKITGIHHYENCQQSQSPTFSSNFLKLRSSFDSEDNTTRNSSSTEGTVSTTSSALWSEYEVLPTSENIYEDVLPPEESQSNETRLNPSDERIITSRSADMTEKHKSSESYQEIFAGLSSLERKPSVIKDRRTKRLVRNSWKTTPLYQNYFSSRYYDDTCQHTYQQHSESSEISRSEAAVQRSKAVANSNVLFKPIQQLDNETDCWNPESEKELQQEEEDDIYVDMCFGKASIGSENDKCNRPADRVSYEVMLNQCDNHVVDSSHYENIYECVEDILAVCSEEDKAMKMKMEDIEEGADSFVVRNKQPPRLDWYRLPEVVESGVLGTLSNREKALYGSKYELITSKVSYLKSLTILQTVFVESADLRAVLPKETQTLLFGFVSPIKRCSEHFLADLLSGWPRDLFLNDMVTVVERYASSALDVYVAFCSEQVRIYEMLKVLKQTNKEFKKVLTQIESDEILEGHRLESFLILPVQRITRFPLLVGSILCHLDPDHDHEELLRWRTVHERLLQVTVECNEAVRLAEESQLHEHETKPGKSPRGKGNEKRSRWFALRKVAKSP